MKNPLPALVLHARLPDPAARVHWFLFRGTDVLIAEGQGPVTDSYPHPLGLSPLQIEPVGMVNGVPCVAGILASDTEAPALHQFTGLRALPSLLSEEMVAAAWAASQFVHFARAFQFCPMCAKPLAGVPGTRARLCTRCEHEYYPPIAPCSIVLVHDDDRVLMTRSPRHPAGMYGLVAGFLEPGESLEACAAREVQEETGVLVRDVRYFGNQPWPFPSQLMVGFTAEYAGGDIRVDRTELEDARWFTRGALPKIPPTFSIARKLIDAWCEEKL